jgi:hypothetical protein
MNDAIVLGSIVCIYIFKKIDTSKLDVHVKRKIVILKYKTIGVLLWPFVFYNLIPKEELETSKLTIAFLWPFIMWVWDSYLLTYGLISEKSTSNVASARLDPTTISSMSFALFGLLGGSSNSKYSYIFLYAVLACFAFVFPNHNLASGSPEDLVVEAIQKIVLSWAIGMLFAGVTLQHYSQQLKIKEECKNAVVKT